MKAIMYVMVPTCEHESLICVALLLVNVCVIGYIQQYSEMLGNEK